MKPSVAVRLSFVLLTSLVASSGCYMFRKSDSFYGLKTAAGQKVVFVIDVSGSMEGKDEGSVQDRVAGAAAAQGGHVVGNAVGGPLGGIIGKQTASEATKLGMAKRELIPAIQGLPESTSFSIVTFGADVKPWPGGMVAADSTHRAEAVAFVKNLDAHGGTPAKKALEETFKYADATMVFFLSDGRPTDGSAPDILAAVRGMNGAHKVALSTVGLGDDQDQQFLGALAAENGGAYVKK